jgi:hypothetical protein
MIVSLPHTRLASRLSWLVSSVAFTQFIEASAETNCSKRASRRRPRLDDRNESDVA